MEGRELLTGVLEQAVDAIWQVSFHVAFIPRQALVRPYLSEQTCIHKHARELEDIQARFMHAALPGCRAK